MNNNSEVMVIGGGAIGVCSAYYLHRHGCRVTLLEMGEICSGCSHGNAGLIVPSGCVPLAAPGIVAKGIKRMFNPESPFYIKPRLDPTLISWLWRFWRSSAERRARQGIPLLRDLSLASLRLFEELAGLEDVAFGFQKKGMLHAYNTEDGLEESKKGAELLDEYGIEVRIMNRDEVHELFPGRDTRIIGGAFYPQDAHITPQRFVGRLADYLEKQGVTIHRSTEVLGFDTSGGSISTVRTTRGDFSAEEVVLAAGSWSRPIADMLDVNLRIEPAKGYSITVKRPDAWPEVPMVFGEAMVGMTPMMETLRFAGTLELAGFDFSINRRRVEAILKAIPRYIPSVKVEDLEVIEIWRGLRPCTPDGLPFLGRSRAYKNLTVAAGHAMIGVSLGPITGKLVSQIVAGEETDIDVTALRVERFG